MDWFVKKTIKNVLVTVPLLVAVHAFINSEEPGQFLKTAFYCLVATLIVTAVILYIRYFAPLRKGKGFPFVYVNPDGSVRELTRSEQDYVSTEFAPADGGRPHIKDRYDQKSFGGRIEGFIYRNRVPARIPISPVAAETSF